MAQESTSNVLLTIVDEAGNRVELVRDSYLAGGLSLRYLDEAREPLWEQPLEGRVRLEGSPALTQPKWVWDVNTWFVAGTGPDHSIEDEGGSTASPTGPRGGSSSGSGGGTTTPPPSGTSGTAAAISP